MKEKISYILRQRGNNASTFWQPIYKLWPSPGP